MNHHPEHAGRHEKHHGSMVATVQRASEVETIEQFRSTFSEITENLIRAVEKLGYNDGPLFIQFCPMADDGNGAKWLSDNEEILNPYYGARMLKCGRVLEQVES